MISLFRFKKLFKHSFPDSCYRELTGEMMHSAIKLIIGVIVALAGLYWYVADFFGRGVTGWIGTSALSALKTVFIGVFGLLLIFVGLVVAWIEVEDLKWQSREKTDSAKAAAKKK